MRFRPELCVKHITPLMLVGADAELIHLICFSSAFFLNQYKE